MEYSWFQKLIWVIKSKLNFIPNKIKRYNIERKRKYLYSLTYTVRVLYDVKFLRIHIVKVSKIFNTVTYKIHLERPGILVGKQGESVKLLIKRLRTDLKMNVKIKIYHYEPLPNLY
jgi:ribosomal protein S3